ncbi:MAG: hypothetical protein ABI867_15500 [Kofleriaceae bacterium]
MRTTITVSLLLASTSIATADDRIHDFATLDRATGSSGAGAELSFITGDLDELKGAISRLDLHAEYVLPSGFGAYGAFAVSKAFLSAKDPADQMFADAIGDATAISNLELGAQYRRKLNDELTIVGHAGLSLPTASDDDPGAFLTNVLSSPRRFNDLVTAFPEITTLRVGISPIWHRGAVFARADLGADIVLDEPAMTTANNIFHANLAVGARTGKLSGALELVTLGTTEDVSDDEDRFLHTGALSLRYDAGRFAPSLSIVTPLDDGGLGEIISIGAGVAAAF